MSEPPIDMLTGRPLTKAGESKRYIDAALRQCRCAHRHAPTSGGNIQANCTLCPCTRFERAP